MLYCTREGLFLQYLLNLTLLYGTDAEYTTMARIFSLPEAKLAHELSQTGHGRGRIVLHIAD